MRMCAQHRNTTNSNGNQVCPVFCRTQWECTSFVRYEDNTVDRPPTITKWSDDPRRDTCSVDRRREMHGSFLFFFFFFQWFWFWCSEMNPVRKDLLYSWPMVEMRTFNRLTCSVCTTTSKPATSALATGVQSPNAFSDPTLLVGGFSRVLFSKRKIWRKLAQTNNKLLVYNRKITTGLRVGGRHRECHRRNLFWRRTSPKGW